MKIPKNCIQEEFPVNNTEYFFPGLAHLKVESRNICISLYFLVSSCQSSINLPH